MRKTGEGKQEGVDTKPMFQGQGQTLRGGVKRKGDVAEEAKAKGKGKEGEKAKEDEGKKLSGGRTLKDGGK